MANLSATRSVSYLVNGQDAVLFRIVPSATTAVRSGDSISPERISFSVTKKVGANTATSAATTEYYAFVRFMHSASWTRLYSTQFAVPSASSSVEIKITEPVTDGATLDICTIPVVAEGESGPQGDRGSQGAMPRFFVWSEVVSYLLVINLSNPRRIQFYSGADGEPYYDIMSVEGSNGVTYYRCKQSFTLYSANTNNIPGVDTTHWEPAVDGWGFIATRLIMAQYGIVRNLCSEYISCVKDGVIKFEVDRDGNVTANTGTFQGVNVRGNLCADGLSLTACRPATDGVEDPDTPELITQALVVTRGGYYALPKIEPGFCRNIDLLVVHYAHSANMPSCPLRLQGAVEGDVYFMMEGDASRCTDTLDLGEDAGLYKLVGWGMDVGGDFAGKTLWNVTRIDDATSAAGRGMDEVLNPKTIPNAGRYRDLYTPFTKLS